METLPVETIAHIFSYLPLDARRFGTYCRKFGKAFRLYHSKSRIAVDITVSTHGSRCLMQGGIQQMKLKIGTKDGSVTLDVKDDIIEIEKNTDAYTIEFCKSFFSLAEICGLLKPTYGQFLTNFLPLIKIKNLSLDVVPSAPLYSQDVIPLTTLLLVGIRKVNCEVKTITYSTFPVEDIWTHFFDEGRCDPKEDRVRLTDASGRSFMTRISYRLRMLKNYASFGRQFTEGAMFLTAVKELIERCYYDVNHANEIIILKGSELTMNNMLRLFLKNDLDPKIQWECFEEFTSATSVNELPLEFEVVFNEKGRGLDAFLEIEEEGATYRFVSKNL